MSRDICMTCECEIGCGCMCEEPVSPTDIIAQLRTELAAKDALLAEATTALKAKANAEAQVDFLWHKHDNGWITDALFAIDLTGALLAKLKEQE